MLLVRMWLALLLSIIAAVVFPLPGLDHEVRAEPERPFMSIAPAVPRPDDDALYGAIAFTPDGSFFSVWRIGSRTEAEDKVRAECAALGRGACEAMSFRSEICAAIASAQIGKQRKITYSGGGLHPAMPSVWRSGAATPTGAPAAHASCAPRCAATAG